MHLFLEKLKITKYNGLKSKVTRIIQNKMYDIDSSLLTGKAFAWAPASTFLRSLAGLERFCGRKGQAMTRTDNRLDATLHGNWTGERES